MPSANVGIAGPFPLTLDEFEAIRLVDGEGLGQDTVAERMGVSRPTVTRIVASARSKIARVLINGQALQIQGGPVVQEPIARSFGRGGRCGRAWGGRSGRPGREGMRRGRSVGAPENQASRDAGSQQADQAESTRRQR